MTFANQKKTFLAKMDQSKKGSIDEKAIPIIEAINKHNDLYTTSSCSGRVYLWKGDGKKNHTEWLNVSHDIINDDFFTINEEGLVWLRFEGFILHVACENIDVANQFLQKAQQVYKKSSILSISNKIIVEIQDSQKIEMPFSQDRKLLFSGDLEWLKNEINKKLEKNWEKINKLSLLFQ